MLGKDNYKKSFDGKKASFFVVKAKKQR